MNSTDEARREGRGAPCACHGRSSARGGSQAAYCDPMAVSCPWHRGGLTEGLGGGEPDAVRHSGDNSRAVNSYLITLYELSNSF